MHVKNVKIRNIVIIIMHHHVESLAPPQIIQVTSWSFVFPDTNIRLVGFIFSYDFNIQQANASPSQDLFFHLKKKKKKDSVKINN